MSVTAGLVDVGVGMSNALDGIVPLPGGQDAD